MNVIVFWPNDDWGLYGRTYEKITEHLEKLDEINRVVCIFPPTEWKHFAFARPVTVRKVSSNLWLLNENRKRSESRGHADQSDGDTGNCWSTIVLKVYLWLLGFRRQNTILWLFPPHPYLDVLVEIMPHSFTVAQIVDDFTKVDPAFWLHDAAMDQYPRVSEFSDVVLTSSQVNYDKFRHGQAQCYLFENAVDESFIAAPSDLPSRISADIPRLGYVGWITDRTDLSLIKDIARRRPDWKIEIAGPQRGHLIEESGLMALPNVSYLGPIPYNEVAIFLQSLDVCLIPHRDTPYSKSMSPLKLYQYLASGRPVVSSDVAGLEDFREYVHVANSYDDFVDAIEDALENDTVELSSLRIDKACNETWDKRVRNIYDAVCQHLDT